MNPVRSKRASLASASPANRKATTSLPLTKKRKRDAMTVESASARLAASIMDTGDSYSSQSSDAGSHKRIALSVSKTGGILDYGDDQSLKNSNTMNRSRKPMKKSSSSSSGSLDITRKLSQERRSSSSDMRDKSGRVTVRPETNDLADRPASPTISAAYLTGYRTSGPMMEYPSSPSELEKGAWSLPPMYELLLSMFDALESVLSIYTRNRSMVTYDNVRVPVEQLCGRAFQTGHLAQIIHVYPEAYVVARIKLQKSYTYRITSTVTMEANRNADPNVINQYGNTSVVLNSDELIRTRRTEMKSRLTKMVRREHLTFLKTLSKTEQEQLRSNKLKDWHPQFDLNTVADIPLDTNMGLQEHSTLTRVSTKSNDLSPKSKLAAGLAREDAVIKATVDEHKKKNPPPVRQKKRKKALRGLNPALLAQLEHNDAQLHEEKHTGNARLYSQLAQLNRLSVLVTAVMQYVIAERKTAFEIHSMVKGLCKRNSRLRKDEMLNDVEYLCELVPSLFSMKMTRIEPCKKLFCIVRNANGSIAHKTIERTKVAVKMGLFGDAVRVPGSSGGIIFERLPGSTSTSSSSRK